MMRKKIPQNVAHILCVLIGLLLLVITLTIHGSTAYANIDFDACELLTLEDVQAVLAEKVEKRPGFPKNMEYEGGKIVVSRCFYDAIFSNRMVGLHVTFRPNARYPKTLKEYIELSKYEKGISKKTLEEAISVQRIGNLAVWTVSEGVGNLNVYWKDYNILVLTGTTKEDLEAAKFFAKKVINKLKRGVDYHLKKRGRLPS
ncbi:MAG: hypothetical protein SRB2_03708 [Desulfobacteraceae bacterium Eth-SRB2]|nr:MAG: hypothetical protein SRB2_03708 [Desulfobacteraceae bacterium Eth-SRB2]